MKTLIADDDLTSRLLLEGYLKVHSEIHLVVNGQEAVEAVRLALEAGQPFDLICLDINMPELDGQQALNAIRQMETDAGIATKKRVKIFMTTSLGDKANVLNALQHRCDYYLIKPLSQAALLQKLHDFKLIFAPKEWDFPVVPLPPLPPPPPKKPKPVPPPADAETPADSAAGEPEVGDSEAADPEAALDRLPSDPEPPPDQALSA